MVAGRTAPPDGQGASSRNVPLLVALKLQHGSDVQVFSGCDVDAAAPQDQMAVLHGGSGTAVNGHAPDGDGVQVCIFNPDAVKRGVGSGGGTHHVILGGGGCVPDGRAVHGELAVHPGFRGRESGVVISAADRTRIVPGQPGRLIGIPRSDGDLGLSVVMDAHVVAGGDFGEVPCRNPAHVVVCPGQGFLLVAGCSGRTFIAVESSCDVPRFSICDVGCAPLGLFSQNGLMCRQRAGVHSIPGKVPLQVVQKR